jgi:hypothetical protein
VHGLVRHLGRAHGRTGAVEPTASSWRRHAAR